MKGFKRPNAKVLAADSIVPEENLISPPPDRFTHELLRSESYYFSGPQQGKLADGKFKKGTKVVLLKHDGGFCYVADGRGLYVALACDSLKPLVNS